MSVPPLVGSSSGIVLKQRVEMDVRDARVEQAVEAFDEADRSRLRSWLARDDGAVNGGVQRRRIAAGGQNADAFHGNVQRLSHRLYRNSVVSWRGVASSRVRLCSRELRGNRGNQLIAAFHPIRRATPSEPRTATRADAEQEYTGGVFYEYAALLLRGPS